MISCISIAYLRPGLAMTVSRWVIVTDCFVPLEAGLAMTVQMSVFISVELDLDYNLSDG